MKMKNILIVSLATNVVLLSALAYIQSLEINSDEVPPVIYLINRADPDSISAAVDAVALPGIE
jgi:hypothetical protein